MLGFIFSYKDTETSAMKQQREEDVKALAQQKELNEKQMRVRLFLLVKHRTVYLTNECLACVLPACQDISPCADSARFADSACSTSK